MISFITHRNSRLMPVLLLLLLFAYAGWRSLRWLRSVEKEFSKSENSNPVRYTLMFAFIYWLAATATSFAVGFLPEGFLSRYYANTGIAPFAPVIAATGFALGVAFCGRGARWTWIFSLLWFAFGIFAVRGGGSWAQAMGNLFDSSSACRDSECLGELLFTMPCFASFAFSAGANIAAVFVVTTRPDPKARKSD
jgi:hypothetical protein